MIKLKRTLGLFTVTLYGIGVILGAGIYVLIGPAVGEAGNSTWISFFLAALIAILTGLSYCELSSMFPKAAPEYTYTKKAFKNPLLSFLVGWLMIFIGIVGASTVALGFSSYLSGLLGIPIIPSAIVLVIVLSLLNFYGIRESARTNVVLTLIEVLGLVIIIFIGFQYFGRVNYFDIPFGIKGIFSAATIVFFAFLGFEYIATLGEESKRATKTIPKAIVFSILATTLLYVLVALASVSAIDWNILKESKAPLGLVASKALGKNGFLLLSFIALFATANTVLISLISTSRIAYGMASDGSLPKIMAFVHKKRRTPVYAIVFIGLLSIVFILIGKIEIVAKITDLGALIIFSLVNLSLIKLRFDKPKLKRTFKVPLNIGNFPIIPFFGLISCIFLISQFTLDAFVIIGYIIIFGSLIFYLKNIKSSKVGLKLRFLKP